MTFVLRQILARTFSRKFVTKHVATCSIMYLTEICYERNDCQGTTN